MTKKKKPRPAAKVLPAKAPEGFRPFAELEAMRALKAADTTAATRSGSAGVQPSAKPSPPRAREPAADPSPEATWDDDALARHRMMSGVTPLASKATRLPLSQDLAGKSRERELLDERRARGIAPEQEEADAVHAHLRALVEGGRFEVTDDGRRVEGRRTDVTPDVLRKLRRGVLPIDARLDLHGMREGEARTAVERFLGDKRARRERCVLVIHGKGEHSTGGTGVLRGEIAAWLSQGRASAHVAAFATATNDDGGEGAVYVLLRA